MEDYLKEKLSHELNLSRREHTLFPDSSHIFGFLRENRPVDSWTGLWGGQRCKSEVISLGPFERLPSVPKGIKHMPKIVFVPR